MSEFENVKDDKSWRQLKNESALWISDVDYWMDRMTSYQSMLDTAIGKMPAKDELKTIDHLQNIVTYYSKEVLPGLKSRIFHYQEELIGIEKNSNDLDGVLSDTHAHLRSENSRVAETLKGYAEDFAKLNAIQEVSTGSSNEAKVVERILIPTDFSLNAERATDYALSLFDQGLKEVIILNILHSPYKSMGDLASNDAQHQKNQMERLKEETDRIALTHPNLRAEVKGQYEVGFLIEKVEEVAKEHEIDLVVMGTKGETGLSSVLFGSHTSNVVKRLAYPVLVVPNETPMLPPENVMLALDLKMQERPPHFDLFTSLMDHYNSELIVLNVVPPGASMPSVHDRVMEENIVSTLGLCNATVEHVTSKSVKEAINTEVSDRSTDLLCVINHHEGWLYHSLGKSVTTQMVLDTHTPILVFHQ